MSFKPTPTRRSISSTFKSVERGVFSFWRPSRGPTSTILTGREGPGREAEGAAAEAVGRDEQNERRTGRQDAARASAERSVLCSGFGSMAGCRREGAGRSLAGGAAGEFHHRRPADAAERVGSGMPTVSNAIKSGGAQWVRATSASRLGSCFAPAGRRPLLCAQRNQVRLGASRFGQLGQAARARSAAVGAARSRWRRERFRAWLGTAPAGQSARYRPTLIAGDNQLRRGSAPHPTFEWRLAAAMARCATYCSATLSCSVTAALVTHTSYSSCLPP